MYFESRNAVIKQYCDSMKTKVSLSVVSKTFHNVMEIYFYEVVMIFRFQYIPILLQRLQSIPPWHAIPRGHRCRRLDLYLGVGNVPYNACCAKTIRRLELYGFQIRMDRVEMMLRYLTKLKACSIVHVKEFDPLGNIYDDEEPKKRVISEGRCYASVMLTDDWDYSKPSDYFDASTVSEFKAAKADSCWPPFNASAPYTLPNLHTLRLENFDSKRMIQFSFPHLCHLDMYCFSRTEGLSSSRGSFPDSLTHLTYAGKDASIAQIIAFFPKLRYLNLSIEFCKFPDAYFTNPHLCLEVVELATWECFFDPQPQIKDILIAARARKLPRLRMIQVTRSGKRNPPNHFPFRRARAQFWVSFCKWS
ncbi:hypothetical protein C0995_006613 [Termitomyces sp. Mi166|nr:hypothetical protein C0995_006613 [Termitomyces sp. Mi166\